MNIYIHSYDSPDNPACIYIYICISYTTLALRLTQSKVITALKNTFPKNGLFNNLRLVQDKVDGIAENMLHFIHENWFFNNTNCRELEASLSPEDAEQFPLTVRLTPKDCTAVFCYGIAKCLADTPNLPDYQVSGDNPLFLLIIIPIIALIITPL